LVAATAMWNCPAWCTCMIIPTSPHPYLCWWVTESTVSRQAALLLEAELVLVVQILREVQPATVHYLNPQEELRIFLSSWRGLIQKSPQPYLCWRVAGCIQEV
jgi:hypothetical protein